jgi:type II secretory pathway component GspD/PulD (secretin)
VLKFGFIQEFVMRELLLLLSVSMISVVTLGLTTADDRPATNTLDQDKAKQTEQVTIKTYATVKKLLDGDKHKTLAVEMFEIKSGENRRFEGDELGDVFVIITPYLLGEDDRTSEQPKVKRETVKDVGGQKRTQMLMRLSNAAAGDVAEALNGYFKNEVFDNNVGGAPEIVPETVSNSLIVRSGSETQMKHIETMISALDQRPPTFKAKIMIGKTEKDGSVTCLSKPTITTIENLAGRIEIGSQSVNGGWQEGYAVELTMRQVHSN